MNSHGDERNGMGDADRTRRDSSDYLRHTAEHEIVCREFVELVTEYFEGALPDRTRAHVEEHLVMCDWCTTYTDQLETTINGLNELGTEEATGEPATERTPAAEPSPVLLAALRERREGSS